MLGKIASFIGKIGARLWGYALAKRLRGNRRFVILELAGFKAMQLGIKLRENTETNAHTT